MKIIAKMFFLFNKSLYICININSKYKSMSTFSQLKSKLKSNYELLEKNSNVLYFKQVDRDKIWDLYLDGFTDPIEKQSHNCNCCKSFLRQFSGIVSIKDNKVLSMWDFSLNGVDELYHPSVIAIRDYIASLPVVDVFYNSFVNLGTDKNLDKDTKIMWEHFHLKMRNTFVLSNDLIATRKSDKRAVKEALKRSLDDLKIDACESVLELIAQNSLYRGREFENTVKDFLRLKRIYDAIPNENKDAFVWAKIFEVGEHVSKIRGSAIGTLLTNLSENMDINIAVIAFEKVVAPDNYKRPKPVATAKMSADAEKEIQELGYGESLERKFATDDELNINNVLYVDKSSPIRSVFDEIAQEAEVNPKAFSKIEEISIEDFIEKVVPTTKKIEILLENSHLNNMTTLLSAVNRDSPSMFKWENDFSWAYTGGITDSIKEKVKAAGGNVVGELRVSLSWYNHDDLDIHVYEPNGNHIYYPSRGTSHISSGKLDVDMNAGGGTTRTPVENIIWTNKAKMQEGRYKVFVHNYALREKTNSGFIVQVECDGEITDFEFATSPKNQNTTDVVEFSYSKTKGIIFDNNVKTSVLSKERWNLKTNKFHKVKNIMLSPNFWEKQVGNKHFIFALENCICDENPRPFFNEFLKEDLLKHKRLFELLGSKLKVHQTNNQISGVGFSETQRNSFIVRVEGTTKRNLKVNV